MANYSYVMAEFKLLKDGKEIDPQNDIVDLIKKVSSDEVFQNEDLRFSMSGRWTFDNNLTFIEMQEIVSWLREHTYDGMIVNYSEYEESSGFASIGRATYTIRNGIPYETVLKIETCTWTFDEFCQTFLGNSFPDMNDYEDDDRYTEDFDAKIEEISTYLDVEMMQKENITFEGLEYKVLPV